MMSRRGFLGTVYEIFGVRRVVAVLRVKRTLQVIQLALDLEGSIVSIGAKSTIRSVLDGSKSERGIELTDILEKRI
jgi:hypothetical protein